MAIDSSIYSQIQQPKPVNLLAQYADAMQVQGAQQANQLNQLRLMGAQRDMERQNKLAGMLEGGADAAALRRGGFIKEANDWEEADAKRAKASADLKTSNLSASQKQIELTGQIFGHVRANPTPENAAAAFDAAVRYGLMPAEEAQQFKTLVAADPSKIGNFADGIFRAALSAKDQLPTTRTTNTGGFTVNQAFDAVTGKATETGRIQNTQSPDNAASVGAQYANAAATREIANATRDAARIKANQDVEMKLGDDYRAQSKGFKEVSDAYRTINATLDKATTSPAATLAGATKFMKLLDPGSVVRESELGMALAATGVFDRAANYFNTLRSGKVLTANQVADFKNITGQIYQAAQEGQKQVDAHYRQQAKTYGLRPEMIVQELGQGTAAPVDLGSLPAGGGKIVDFGSLK